MLFLVYINDLDSKILFISLSLRMAQNYMTGPVPAVGVNKSKKTSPSWTWSVEWLMAFNVDKCKVMHLGHNNQRYKCYFGNQEFSTVEEEDLKLVMITANLKSSKQCTMACNKAMKIVGVVNHTIKFKNKQIPLSLYKSLMRPLLEYSTPAWSSHYVKDNFCSRVRNVVLHIW